MRLEGKIALVTGAAQGIGRAIALTLAREGADIIVNDVNLEEAEKVAEEVRALGRRALAVKADVSKRPEANRMVEQAVKDFSRIDILVNNAAPSDRQYALIEDTTEEIWDKHLNTGLKGTFLCSQAVGRQMIKQKYGKIVNIASNAGASGFPGQVAYSASKAGIIQLTKTFAVEWGKHNINVNSVSPSVTQTPHHFMLEKEKPGRYLGHMKRYPIKRFNRPEDIANAVLFLASSEADNISGRDLLVDSGIGALWSGYFLPEDK